MNSAIESTIASAIFMFWHFPGSVQLQFCDQLLSITFNGARETSSVLMLVNENWLESEIKTYTKVFLTM